MAELKLRGLRKRYANGVEVLRGIDMDIHDGEFAVFVGPSGCGKSTLLRLIAGLETLTQGQILIGGRDVSALEPVDRGVAMVFQSYALYPHMSVEQNMGFALKMAGQSAAEVRRQVGEVAEVLQLGALMRRKPAELSGGQRQRVAIGRAIVRRPAVFLFDEPLSNLDASLRVQMRIELSRLHRELGTTMVYVTHDQVEAMTLGDRIAVFNGGQVEQMGAPLELFEQPRSQFVAGFLGSPRMNMLPVQARHGQAGGCLVRLGGQELALHQRGGGSCTLGVRAEHLRLLTAEAGLPVQVELVEHLGDTVIAYVNLGHGLPHLAVRLAPEQDAPAPGQTLRLQIPADKVHLFDDQGLALAA